MTIKEGDKLPEVTLHHMTENGPTPITTSELFSGKKSVLFAVPGAFTPGCSMQHLPGFVSNSDEILSKGVDQIVCLSVNDAFVMDAWGKSQGVGNKIIMMSDPFLNFTKSIGAEIDKKARGLGLRSNRYTMYVEDMKVIKLQEEKDTGSCEISAAENFLNLV